MANSLFLGNGVNSIVAGTNITISPTNGLGDVTINATSLGTVSSVSVVTANGVSGSVATATTTPAITLTLGAITPASVASAGAVSDSVGAMSALRSGAIGIPSQATGDLITASSSTQFGRVAAGTTGQILRANTGAAPSYSTATYPATAGTSGNVLTSDGTNWASTAPSSSKMTLLKASSGSSSAAGTTTLDSVAISGLTALDTLIVDYVIESMTQDTAGFTAAYNSTDSLVLFGPATVTAGNPQGGQLVLQNGASASTTVLVNPGTNAGTIRATVTMTTAWTGSWTLAIRHTGVTAGGTAYYKWAVYKVAGQ